MKDILLISEKTLKSQSYINDNVDSCYIVPSIRSAQDIGLQPLIGTNLYVALQDKIQSNSIEGDYKILMDEYITPYLVNRVMMEIQLPLAYKMRNSGVVQSNNEYETNTYLKDAKQMSVYYEQKSDFYGLRLTSYLNHNSSKFPEYTTGDCSDIKPSKENYNTNIVL
jgi:hypothetical protein